jgi:plasmid stabilization system protein ParE
MKVRLLARAERDVATAADFYESARPGLGGQFFADLDATLMLLRHQSYLGVAVSARNDYRQMLLKHFPYRLIYRVTRDALIVIAVHHQRQHPRSWQNRVQESKPVYA